MTSSGLAKELEQGTGQNSGDTHAHAHARARARAHARAHAQERTVVSHGSHPLPPHTPHNFHFSMLSRFPETFLAILSFHVEAIKAAQGPAVSEASAANESLKVVSTAMEQMVR